MGQRFGYISNGFRDHALEDMCALLHDLGYEGIGITLDVGHLHPWQISPETLVAWRDRLRRYALTPVVETGARFLLDPRRKHWPTLISREGREVRLAFLERAIEIASILGSGVVSLWSGARDPRVDREATWGHLIAGLRALLPVAAAHRLRIGFEPEPGMFIESLDDLRELIDRLGPSDLGVTLDLGHLQVTEQPPHDRWIRELADRLVNVHVDDVRDRVHQHLPLGEGEIDFPPLFRALDAVGYRGLCLVELSRHSHCAPSMAERSIAFLRALGPPGQPTPAV